MHPKRANVSKEELEGKLAERFRTKKGCCVVYGLKTQFGGSKSSGFALVYDNEEYRHKYDSIPHLRKVIIPLTHPSSSDSSPRRVSPAS